MMIQKNFLTHSAILIGVFSFTFFISCTSLVKSFNGEKKPRQENLESLKAFVEETNLDINFEKNFYLKNKIGKQKIVNSDLVYVETDSIIIPYGLLMFDQNWNGLNYDSMKACLIDELESDEFYPKIKSLNETLTNPTNLNDLKNAFIDFKGKPYFPFKKNEKALAIVIWAKYKGKMWAEETNAIIDQLKNSNAEYDIYYLNLDPNQHYSQLD